MALEDVFAGYIPGMNVLQGVSMRVNEGEIVCLIGPNGAGKSTVLRTISGLIRPSAGKVIFQGESIAGHRPDVILRKGVCHVPQGHSVFPKMSVRENLLMGGYSLRDRNLVQRRISRVYNMFPFLAERRHTKAGVLSGGQQKILEIGRAMMLEPPLMLLDEPSLGLAPKMARMVFDTIKRLKDEAGITILMVEQNAKSGLATSDRGYVLELGRERLEGPASQLLNDPIVAKLYLGGTIAGDLDRAVVLSEGDRA
jgi:ABC-type branched-subunit amino acid transport system ATPase component